MERFTVLSMTGADQCRPLQEAVRVFNFTRRLESEWPGLLVTCDTRLTGLDHSFWGLGLAESSLLVQHGEEAAGWST
jgi:hypothetical protein